MKSTDLKRILYTVSDNVRHLLFPRRCIGCGKLTEGLSAHTPFCTECSSTFDTEYNSCCSDCGKQHRACRCFPHTGTKYPQYHLLPYKPGSKKYAVTAAMLLRIKDVPDRDTVLFLAEELKTLCQQIITENGYDPAQCVLAYAPRSPKNYRKTGVDQARALTQALSLLTDLPVVYALRHNKNDRIQKDLSTAQRLENAQTSYCIIDKPNIYTTLSSKHVILIDDIMTSGATLMHCASLLTKAGAKSVVCLTVAKST